MGIMRVSVVCMVLAVSCIDLVRGGRGPITVYPKPGEAWAGDVEMNETKNEGGGENLVHGALNMSQPKHAIQGSEVIWNPNQSDNPNEVRRVGVTHAELHFLCPTTSCLRERRLPDMLKELGSGDSVGLGNYECFNPKEGTASLPYSPPKDAVRHTEPDGLHSFQCVSKFRCAAPYFRWKEETQKSNDCDYAISELEADMRKVAPLSPFEMWFVGDVNVGEAKMKNHTDSVQEYEDAVERENVACLRKSHWEHVAGPILSVEAYADSARRAAEMASKTLSAAKERLTNAQMGKLSRGEKWYISRGLSIEQMEKVVSRALKAKAGAEARWGSFEMQAENAEIAGPGIMRELRHARMECQIARNATRDALFAKQAATKELRLSEGKQIKRLQKKVAPHLSKLKNLETSCTDISRHADEAHTAYHLCRLGNPAYVPRKAPAAGNHKDMMDDEHIVLHDAEANQTFAENEDEDAPGISGPTGSEERDDNLESADARRVFETGSTGSATGAGLTGAELVCPSVTCASAARPGCQREASDEVDSHGCKKYPCGREVCSGPAAGFKERTTSLRRFKLDMMPEE